MALIQLKDAPVGCSRCVALRRPAPTLPHSRLRDVSAEEGNSDEALTVSLPVSKATIASRLSLTPEYFSRVLHEFEAAGMVRIDKRDVHILDPKRLASYQPP